MPEPSERAVVGCLLGTAVGDALGLPGENLSPRRLERLYGHLDSYRFLFGRGMCSDDTEHACMVAQALLASKGGLPAFTRSLAWRLRGWLIGGPAGVGFATLRSCLRLWFGVSPARSGVWSAGNGPAMRAPILGVCLGDTPDLLRAFVRTSTLMTHRDPRAGQGALAIALAAHVSAGGGKVDPTAFRDQLRETLGNEAGQLLELIERARTSVERGESTRRFAADQGWKRGVSGFIVHTVPAVLHAWFRHPDDINMSLEEVIACGGDTDTTAAMLGGIVGARVGKEGIPQEWLSGLWEWPRTAGWIERLGRRLAEGGKPLPLFWPGLLPRNLFFFGVVVLHVLRRLLPPY